MILLFEGHKYPSNLIAEYIKDLKLDGIKKGSRNGVEWTAVKYVGYFYYKHPESSDIVYILPKVFIYKNANGTYVSEQDVFEDSDDIEDNIKEKDSIKYLAFGEFEPEDLVNVINKKDDADFLKKFNRYKDFIQQLTIWIYRAIHRYYDNNPHSHACISSMSRSMYSNGKRKKPATWLDYKLALIQFANDNKSFFTFVHKQAHSGYNKVNWKKTVNKTLPILNQGTPIYIELVTKKKTINYDEELLVILFSALKDIRDTYNFPVYINPNFNLMNRSEFARFKKNGKRHMLDLKYKYFSDKTIALWNLLYSYFELSENISSNKTKNDYLLVNSFQVVFEDMIDYLISDEPSKYPKELKKQYDGKQIDHIYKDESLLYENDIYYVGDSKYYRDDAELEKKSVKKQYTYAKNIIQRNIDVFKGFDNKPANKEQYLDYRDDETEGYNITPNFFISGIVNKDKPFNFTEDNLTLSDDGFEPNMHFENRLFDRDTLILQRYNINFLYVLSLYARRKEETRLMFKNKAKRVFKEKILEYLEKEYAFYKINLGVQNKTEFIEENFFYLKGKIFSFSDDTIILGWEKDQEQILVEDKYIKFDDTVPADCPERSKRMIITSKTSKYTQREYILLPWSLKERKIITLPTETKPRLVVGVKPESQPVNRYKYDLINETIPLIAAEDTLTYNKSKKMLVGCYKDEEHLNWIMNNHLYNIRLGNREGAIDKSGIIISASKLLLYNVDNPKEYQLYNLDETKQIFANYEFMRDKGYPKLEANREYLLYVIEGISPVIAKFEVEKLKEQFAPDLEIEGAPFYVSL